MKKKTETLATLVANHWTIPKTDIVEPPAPQLDRNTGRNLRTTFERMVREEEEKLLDIEGIVANLPDLYLAQETTISSILSPKDLHDTELAYTVDKLAPPDWADIIKTHFTTVYNINAIKAEMLTEALFTTGSHVKLIIPASMIQTIIRTNTIGLEDFDTTDKITLISESLDNQNNLENIGIIKTTASRYSFEEFCPKAENQSKPIPDDLKAESLLFVDNVGHLVVPLIDEQLRTIKDRQRTTSAYSLEGMIEATSDGRINYPQTSVKEVLEQILFPDEKTEQDAQLNPIVIDIPHHAILPIHKPGSPEKHAYYLIFLDDSGNFVKSTGVRNRYKEMANTMKDTTANQASVGPIVNMNGLSISYNRQDASDRREELDLATATAEYGRLFNAKCFAAIDSSGKRKTIEISDANEFYEMMLFRQIARQRTKVLIVPADLILYIAFNYNKMGVGVSLLEKTKTYGGFRATLNFASFLAAVQMSINRNTLNLTIDEDDPDKQGTIDQYLHEFLTLKQVKLPFLFSKLNPSDVINEVQRAGTQVKINAGSKFPTMGAEVNESKSDITPPDSDIQDRMRDIHYAGLLTNAAAVEGFANADFATAITTTNLYHARIHSKIQERYIFFLKRLIQMYIFTGGPLYNALKESFEKANIKDASFIDCVHSISPTLPKADTAVLTTQSQEYDAFSSMVTKIVEEAFMSKDIIDGLIQGDVVPGAIDAIKASIIALAKRQYIASENILPEITAMFTNNEDSTTNMISAHIESMIQLISRIYNETLKYEDAAEKVTKKFKDKYGLQEESTDEDNETDEENNEEDEFSTDDNEFDDGTEVEDEEIEAPRSDS